MLLLFLLGGVAAAARCPAAGEEAELPVSRDWEVGGAEQQDRHCHLYIPGQAGPKSVLMTVELPPTNTNTNSSLYFTINQAALVRSWQVSKVMPFANTQLSFVEFC